MEEFIKTLQPLFHPVGVLILIIMMLALNSWIFRRIKSSASGLGMIRRTISFLLALVGTLAIILSLPIDKSLKSQILSFLGIIISAGIALSSTTTSWGT